MPNHSLKFHSDANYPKRRSEELRRLKKSVGRGEREFTRQSLYACASSFIHPSAFVISALYLTSSMNTIDRIGSFSSVIPVKTRSIIRTELSSNCPFGGGGGVAWLSKPIRGEEERLIVTSNGATFLINFDTYSFSPFCAHTRTQKQKMEGGKKREIEGSRKYTVVVYLP